jgi:hypothetical protein
MQLTVPPDMTLQLDVEFITFPQPPPIKEQADATVFD